MVAGNAVVPFKASFNDGDAVDVAAPLPDGSYQPGDGPLGLMHGTEHGAGSDVAASILLRQSSSFGRSDLMDAERTVNQLYPMYVVDWREVIKIDPRNIPPHEELLKSGLAHVREEGEACVFVSHQWLGWTHPFPNEGEQFKYLQKALTNLASGKISSDCSHHLYLVGGKQTKKGKEWKKLFEKGLSIWLDWFSVPQPSAGASVDDLTKAVESIPAYVFSCDHTFVLTPPVHHADQPGNPVCDLNTWGDRGWCRLEALAHYLGPHGNECTLLIKGDHEDDIYYRSPFDVITQPVGTGHFTVETDRVVLAEVVLNMLSHKLKDTLEKNDMFMYRWFRSMKSYICHGLVIPLKMDWAEEKTWTKFQVAYKFDSPNQKCKLGYTPLMYAVMSGNIAVAKELITDHGANVNAALSKSAPITGSFGGESVLGIAMHTTCGHIFQNGAMIDLLLDHGAKPFFSSKVSGYNALNEAALFGNTQAAEHLLTKYPQFVTDPPAPKPLFYHTPICTACIFNKTECLNLFVEKGLDASQREGFGFTAIGCAALNGNVELLKRLLQIDGQLAQIDDVAVPLHFFPGKLAHNILKVKHKYGKPNKLTAFFAECCFGTAVHMAISENFPAVLEELLKAGASTQIKNKLNELPLDMARRLGRAEAVETLENHNALQAGGTEPKISTKQPGAKYKVGTTGNQVVPFDGK